MHLALTDSRMPSDAMEGKPLQYDGLTPRGVLVVGMGDEARGDRGVGLHLIYWLAQLDWPSSVVFCAADESVPERANRFARVILLEALEGPSAPGALYQFDPEALLAHSVGGSGSGMGLLTMLPTPVRKRVAIFGVHPRTASWGAPLSREVMASLPLVVPYLRARILAAAGELARIN